MSPKVSAYVLVKEHENSIIIIIAKNLMRKCQFECFFLKITMGSVDAKI